ncbi:MAG: hypothetical protein JEZ02_19110 [Desulfatibacillum sp.]|nr:hypothetical protein [Desulfatibacillum sp.]
MKIFIIALCCLMALPASFCFAQDRHEGSVRENTEIRGDLSHDILEESPDPGLDSFFKLEGDLEELGNPDLAAHTGQVGIRIDMSLEVTGGYLSWGDFDGYVEDGEPGDPGYLTFSGMRMNDGEDPVGPMIINNLVINTGYNSKYSYMTIGLPDLIGRISFDDVKLGTGVDQGRSLGGLEFGDFYVRESNFEIRTRF